jgi:hypothetical protein
MLLLAKNDDFRDFRRHEVAFGGTDHHLVETFGGKWSSHIFDDLAHFSIVENL